MGKYLRPWWVNQKWTVKAIAILDSPSGKFKRGDWIEIYSEASKKEAQQLAKAWSAKHNTPTMVEPGPGHPSRRGT